MRADERGWALPEDVGSADYAHALGDPGEFPFTRGQRVSRGPRRWKHQELSGEGSPLRSNRQLRYLLEQGAEGLDVIGDAPTVALLDPDHPYARYSVGTQGVSLCRAQDYVDLYDGLPLDKVAMSHSLPPAFAIAGLHLAARRHGYDPSVLRGSVINDPCFGEDYAYATHMPFELRMRLALDAIEFATTEMPKFHPFVEDTYFISDGGPGPVDEMALGFLEIREVVRRLIGRGLDVDAFARRIAILVNCRMELFGEIAKIRATRRIFARMMRDEFGARDPRSWSVNITVHTSGATLTAQQPVNNVIRGALQAFAMAAAGVKAMEVSAFDEAYRTPSEAAHLVGLRTQQIVALETDVLGAADPLGGSYFVEALTNDIEEKILARVRHFESAGALAEQFDAGTFKSLMQQAMADFGASISTGERPVVGVNCHTVPEEEDTLLREHTDEKIQPDADWIGVIRAWRADRDMAGVGKALDALAAAVGDATANLVPAIIEAFEAEASVGEMARALRRGYGVGEDPVLSGTAS